MSKAKPGFGECFEGCLQFVFVFSAAPVYFGWHYRTVRMRILCLGGNADHIIGIN
jgi:hypothetical protein